MINDERLENWEIDCLIGYHSTFTPKIPEGWEPFAVEKIGANRYSIWVRRKKGLRNDLKEVRK